jgi:hypothetical protein
LMIGNAVFQLGWKRESSSVTLPLLYRLQLQMRHWTSSKPCVIGGTGWVTVIAVHK